MNDASRFGADAQNTVNAQNTANRQQGGLFTAGALNDANSQDAGFRQQAGLANQSALNNRASENAGFRQQSTLANQSALNNASQFNSAQEQQNRQFNAGQNDNQLNRALSAAGLMGNLQGQYDDGQRADIAQLLQAGGVQRGIAQQEAGSDLALAQLLSQLTGQLPINAVSGQTVNSSGTSNTTRKESNPLGFAGSALSFFA